MSITHLKAGDPAPDFTATDHTGKTVKLKDFLGQRVILFFYPHDLTPTCTVQACNLSDSYAELQKKGYHVLGVSEDDEKKHVKFVTKHSLPFPLLVDTDHTLLEAYGVWGEKKFMGRTFDGTHRTTFVINEKGILSQVITKVKSKIHAEQILEGEAD